MLREIFWVAKVSSQIKQLIAKCESCKEERGSRYHVPGSPALPSYRFNVTEPFMVCAVDMTGHEWVSNDKDDTANKL